MMNLELLYKKYKNKKKGSWSYKHGFELTFDEYVQLAIDANIQAEDIGHMGYHLSRVDDTGAYKVGNCRFIMYADNYAEKKISDKSREASRITGKTLHVLALNDNTRIKRIDTFKEINHQQGKSNSQYGTMWITNGSDNTKISKYDDIPNGWVKGRKINRKSG